MRCMQNVCAGRVDLGHFLDGCSVNGLLRQLNWAVLGFLVFNALDGLEAAVINCLLQR